jgi:hypothetical protein
MQSANASSSLGGRSGAVIFAVLRPKTAPAAPKPAPMVELKTPEQQARVERMLSYIPPRFEALKEMLRKGPSPCSRDWVVLQPEIEAAAEQPNGDLMLTLGKGRLKVRLRCEGDFH